MPRRRITGFGRAMCIAARGRAAALGGRRAAEFDCQRACDGIATDSSPASRIIPECVIIHICRVLLWALKPRNAFFCSSAPRSPAPPVLFQLFSFSAFPPFSDLRPPTSDLCSPAPHFFGISGQQRCWTEKTYNRPTGGSKLLHGNGLRQQILSNARQNVQEAVQFRELTHSANRVCVV